MAGLKMLVDADALRQVLQAFVNQSEQEVLDMLHWQHDAANPITKLRREYDAYQALVSEPIPFGARPQ